MSAMVEELDEAVRGYIEYHKRALRQELGTEIRVPETEVSEYLKNLFLNMVALFSRRLRGDYMLNTQCHNAEGIREFQLIGPMKAAGEVLHYEGQTGSYAQVSRNLFRGDSIWNRDVQAMVAPSVYLAGDGNNHTLSLFLPDWNVILSPLWGDSGGRNSSRGEGFIAFRSVDDGSSNIRIELNNGIRAGEVLKVEAGLYSAGDSFRSYVASCPMARNVVANGFMGNAGSFDRRPRQFIIVDTPIVDIVGGHNCNREVYGQSPRADRYITFPFDPVHFLASAVKSQV